MFTIYNVIILECNGAFIISKELVKYDEFDNLLEHRHPNIVEFDEKGKMFVGDSLGMIHIYDISVNINCIKFNCINSLSKNKECS